MRVGREVRLSKSGLIWYHVVTRRRSWHLAPKKVYKKMGYASCPAGEGRLPVPVRLLLLFLTQRDDIIAQGPRVRATGQE